MTKKITIAVKEPAKAWRIVEAEDTLQTYQKIVGGYIEGFYTNYQGIHFFCNEEGKLQGLAPNIMCGGDMIVGSIFAVRDDGEGEFASLTQEDIEQFCGI